MRVLRSLLARLAGMFSGQRAEDELREEMAAHLEMETAEYVRRGLHPDEARRRALLAAGGLSVAADLVRDQRRLPWLDGVATDLRYALRALRRSPAFTLVVVITLGLGIGANTAIFSVVRGLLLKPLPHRGGDRLVYLRHTREGLGGANINFSVPEVRDLRSSAPALGGIAEYSTWSTIYRTTESSERLKAGLVTGNYFDVMGLAPVVGRLTGPNDDGRGAAPVAVLTHELWQKRFGGDSGVVGTIVSLDGKPVTVIGVLEPAPFFPERVDVMLNLVNSEHHLGASMQNDRVHRMTEVVARLVPGATVAQARSQLDAIQARAQNEFHDAYDPASHYRIAAIPFKEVMGERARLTLFLLMGAAAFVLIIAGANVANLTLMRGVRREHELVTRAAIGAGVARLRRLLLTENLALALLGAAFGVVIAVGGLGLLRSLAERYSTRAGEIRLDVVVLSFTLGLSLLVALLLSLLAPLPSEGSLGGRITAGTWRVSGSLKKQRVQRWLVVAQVAVSVVLLAGAGLLTRTMVRLSQVESGLETEQLLTMQVSLITRNEQLDTAASAAAMRRYEEMRREMAAIPGVDMVGVGTLPLRRNGMVFEVAGEGRALEPGEATPRAEWRTADPDYFQAAGIPIVQGRAFNTSDPLGEGTGRVVILNQTLADRLFPGVDPVGQRIGFTSEVLRRLYPASMGWRTVIGVIGNTQDGGLDADPTPAVFTPTSNGFDAGLVIRAHSDVSNLAPLATRVVRRIAPTALIENVMTIAQYRDQSVAPRRLNAALVSLFGLLALLIAAVGIAGVLAFSVSARTYEIGIRMSLGADGGRVQRMILQEGGVLLAAGLVLGIPVAFLATRSIRGLLFDIQPGDPATLLAVSLIMAAIGLLACWIPAARAARIDPAITMRSVT